MCTIPTPFESQIPNTPPETQTESRLIPLWKKPHPKTNFLYRTAHATHQLTQSHKPVHRPPYDNHKIHLFGFNSIKSPEIFLEIDIQQIQHPAFRKHHEFRANSFHQRIIKVSFSNAKKLSFFEYGKKMIC